MRILVTNDDGVRAEGLHALVRVAKRFGEVKVIAPDHERSACGHAMTLRDPLRVRPLKVEGCEAYEVDGVPVDCVNVGLTVAWPDGCDLVLSGLNNGPNLGFDVTYSGTVAGAMEGAINGIWSIALSMAVFVSGAPFHYETGEKWICENLEMLLALPRKELTFLNVNIPAIDFSEIRGYRFVGMGQRVYEDRVIERKDPWGRSYFWQGGVVVMDADQPGTDVQAVSDGFVSITPISLDWTDRSHLERLKEERGPRTSTLGVNKAGSPDGT
jgi:5'-nucleotidase